MNRYGYIKVASIIPEVKVADCEFNTSRIIEMSRQAAERGVRIAVFPELCITAYSCGDLFTKQLLIDKAQSYTWDECVKKEIDVYLSIQH